MQLQFSYANSLKMNGQKHKTLKQVPQNTSNSKHTQTIKPWAV